MVERILIKVLNIKQNYKGFCMTLKTIFFDFNGIICDDEPVHFEIFRKVLAEEGIIITRDEYFKQLIGYDDKACFTAVFKLNEKSLDTEKLTQLIARKSQYYTEEIQRQLIVFPGVQNLIKECSEKFPLGIVSGALRNEIEYVLKAMKIDQNFKVIVSAEDTIYSKPDPDGYLKGLEKIRIITKLEIEPENCLVIEDTPAGIEAAKSAGMKCLAVTNSAEARYLKHADQIYDSLEQFNWSDIEKIFI